MTCLFIHNYQLQITDIWFGKQRLHPTSQNSNTEFDVISNSRDIIDETINDLSHFFLYVNFLLGRGMCESMAYFLAII